MAGYFCNCSTCNGRDIETDPPEKNWIISWISYLLYLIKLLFGNHDLSFFCVLFHFGMDTSKTGEKNQNKNIPFLCDQLSVCRRIFGNFINSRILWIDAIRICRNRNSNHFKPILCFFGICSKTFFSTWNYR